MKGLAMRIDPVTLQIFANHAQAAADSMAFTLFRTAYSTFVKETEDFTTGLAAPDGMTFASPRDLGATWFIGLDYANAIRMVGDYRPGDICITNDPYSGFVCTHSPDLHMWKPIFWQDELIAFAVSHIHNRDTLGYFEPRRQCSGGEQNQGTAVTEHVRQALGRKLRVQRDIGAACLLYRHQANHQI